MIEADKLTKCFGDKVAVKDVSFQLGKGEILGFLGPNGAGKSTTMRLLATFLYPTSGTAVVNGYDILKDPLKVRESIGYLPENAPLYEEMTVRDFLRFAASVRRLKPVEDAVDRVIEQCFIRDVQKQPIYTLSKGYRQRVCFAQAIIHDPAILILDEPTVGLDPNQKVEVRKMIGRMEGKAILLSTHILGEVIAMCRRAIVIAEGQVRLDDRLDNLVCQDPDRGAVKLRLKSDAQESEIRSAFAAIDQVEDVEIGRSENLFCLSIRAKHGKDAALPVLDRVRQNKWEVVSVAVSEGRLENVFRKYTLPQEKA